MQYYNFAPAHTVWDAHVSMTRNLAFPHELGWSHYLEKVGLRRKRDVRAKHTSTLENNSLELTEVPSTEAAVISLCYCSIIRKCKSIISWKTLPWKWTQGTHRSLGGVWLLPLRQGQGLEWGKRGDGSHCPRTQEREQPAGCHPALCLLPCG